jgi:hypothetical protein
VTSVRVFLLSEKQRKAPRMGRTRGPEKKGSHGVHGVHGRFLAADISIVPPGAHGTATALTLKCPNAKARRPALLLGAPGKPRYEFSVVLSGAALRAVWQALNTYELGRLAYSNVRSRGSG